MAINFAETFLRESGASQDRAQSMAEMQLRANQFAQNLALQEAELEISKRAQTLAEEQAKANNINEVNRLAEQARQFDAELNNRKEEFAADLNQRQEELGLSKDELDAKIDQFNRSLDQESERLKQETALAYDRLDQDLKLSLSEQNLTAEMFYADLDFKRPREEAQTEAIQASTDLTKEQIKGIAIDNDINELKLAATKRGIELSQLPISDDMKERLGFKKNKDGTYPEVLADRAIAMMNLDKAALDLELSQETQKLAKAQQTYFERPRLSFEEAAESVKQDRFSRFKTVSPFEMNILNPIKNVLGRAVLGEIPSMEGRVMRGLESEYGVRSKSLLEALQQKSTEGSIVPGMSPDIRNIYQSQANLNTLNPDLFNLNINTSTIAGPNYPFYGADYSNYIQMMMPQEEVIPEQ